MDTSGLLYLLMIPIFVNVSSCTDVLSTTSTKGFYYKIFVMRLNHFTDQDILIRIQGANDLMSSNSNIHLQVIGIKEIPRMPRTVYSEVYSEVDMIHKQTAYDSILYLGSGGRDLIAYDKPACSSMSIGAANLTALTLDQEHKVISTLIYMLIKASHDISGGCGCEGFSEADHRKCVSDDLALQFVQSTKACSCWNKQLDDLVSGRMIDRDWKMSCMKIKPTPTKYAILRNGIVEKGEECDCTAFDTTCKNTCVDAKVLMTTTTTTTEKPTTQVTTTTTKKLPTTLATTVASTTTTNSTVSVEEETTVGTEIENSTSSNNTEMKLHLILVFCFAAAVIIGVLVLMTAAVVIVRNKNRKKRRRLREKTRKQHFS